MRLLTTMTAASLLSSTQNSSSYCSQPTLALSHLNIGTIGRHRQTRPLTMYETERKCILHRAAFCQQARKSHVIRPDVNCNRPLFPSFSFGVMHHYSAHSCNGADDRKPSDSPDRKAFVASGTTTDHVAMVSRRELARAPVVRTGTRTSLKYSGPWPCTRSHATSAISSPLHSARPDSTTSQSS